MIRETTLKPFRGEDCRIGGLTLERNDPRNHTTDTAVFVVHKYKDPDTVLITLSTGTAALTLDSSGNVSIYLTKAQMATLTEDLYHFRLTLTRSDTGDEVTTAYGTFVMKDR